jgi:hypothetical protein
MDDLKEKGRYWELKEEALCGELALEEARACCKADYRMNVRSHIHKLY